ncbi:MAG: carbohydrate kinase family protein [Erysipelotrichaceae bacterium]|nr:carbohydrate kinase family protein [Erysipelotrichaceae bacterium]
MGKIGIIGTVMIDQIMQARYKIGEGRCNKMNCTVAFGGAMRNVAWNLGLLHHEVHFITKMGNDMAAIEAQKDLEKNHVFVYPVPYDGPTPLFISAFDAEKELMFSTIKEDYYVDKEDLFQTVAINTCEYGITDRTDASFLRKLFDRTSNVKWILCGPVSSSQIIPHAHGMILNRYEMLSISKDQNIDAAAQQMILSGLDWLVVTLDREGAMFYDKKSAHYYPIEEKMAYSTLGCGDAFISGFVHALCEKKSLHECMLTGLEASDIILRVPASTHPNLLQLINESIK